MDIAVSFFSLLTFYSILEIENDNLNIKKIALVFLFSTAAALTKQAGFIILIFSIIWIIWLLTKNRKNLPLKKIGMIIALILFIILFNLYWYIIKIIEIYRGLDFSTLKFLLQDIHHNANYFQRFVNGLNSLKGSIIFFLILTFLSLISIFNKKSRWCTIGITIPNILIWGFFFSYDDRNIIPAFPFIAYSVSFGITYLYEIFFRKMLGKTSLNKYILSANQKLSKVKYNLKIKGSYTAMALLIILILISITIFFNNSKIINEQINSQKLLGYPSINKLLYDYKDKNKIEGKIIRDYYWITILPEFEGSSIRTFKENDNFIILSNSDSYELINPIELTDDNTFGFLISGLYYNNPEFLKDFRRKISNGEYSLLFEKRDYYFIKINR